jgi:hypothetical protein
MGGAVGTFPGLRMPGAIGKCIASIVSVDVLNAYCCDVCAVGADGGVMAGTSASTTFSGRWHVAISSPQECAGAQNYNQEQ